MGRMIRLAANDSHEFDAWLAEPEGTPKAGVIILQEIFGITRHIRAVTDQYASLGYRALAPGLFDRVRPGTDLDYTAVDQGREIMMSLDLDLAVRDIDACAAWLADAGKIAAVGYCWGGAMADLAACRSRIDCAAAYYGRMIVDWLDERPRCPVIYHFGETDPLIPPDVVQSIRGGRPDGEFHVYPGAGHGFNCNDRADFDAEAAALALQRTLAFFDRNL